MYETSGDVAARRAAEKLAADLVRAEQLYQAGDLVAAERAFRDLAARDPSTPPRLRLAAIATRTHRHGEAERWLREALAADPDRIETRYSLIFALLRQRRGEDASRELRAATEYGPGDEGIELEIKAALAIAAGRLDQAARYYEDLAALSPRDPAAPLGLGVVKALAGDYPGALASLDDAAALAPAAAVVWYDRALVQSMAGNAEGAVADGRRAVELDPWFVGARNNLAAVLIGLGRTEEAAAELDAAIARRATYAPAHGNLGVVRLVEGDLPGAVAALEKAVHHAPRTAAFHFNLGVAYARSGDLAKAKGAFDKVLELDPGNSGAARNLRWIEGKKAGTLSGDLPVATAMFAIEAFAG